MQRSTTSSTGNQHHRNHHNHSGYLRGRKHYEGETQSGDVQLSGGHPTREPGRCREGKGQEYQRRWPHQPSAGDHQSCRTLENLPDDMVRTWCNKFCDWRPRWTRRTPRRRAPALVSQKGVAGDGSAILPESTCSK